MRDNNGQSAAKPLLNEERSTTIPRKGSSEEIHEKVDSYIYTFKDKLPHKSGIYVIKNLITNKVYVGSCSDFHNRKRRHYYYLRKNIHHSEKLQRSFNKYGENNFRIIIIEFTENLLTEREKYFLIKYNSYINGYNATDNILFHYKKFKLSKDQIEKRISKSSKSVVALDLEGKYVKTYSSVSEAARDLKDQPTNISKCCNGKLRYIKNRMLIYEKDYDSNKKYILQKRNTCKGVKRSLKTKQKLSLIRSKSISKYDLFNNLIKTYISVTICAKENNTDRSTISRSIKQNKPHRGFVYKYN